MAVNLLDTSPDDTTLGFGFLNHPLLLLGVPWSRAKVPLQSLAARHDYLLHERPAMSCDRASNSGAPCKGPFPYKVMLARNHAKLFRELNSRLQNFPDAVENASWLH
ncbi:hypothetical protein COCC4DRAFT_28839 [Bipolaris maydis ATCC 48331]|uniref:Uncharacterized protein n=2 Tax=Cochliobolus heterostrophus TaxID=5016 RepID=M2TT00_COCH5|nr:uncharacterized protein COCC4DRAFT_28839 [Bipolaris maydis ATCC 48331]EMD84901.1 hypothetical protein COCHEDRAFT_1035896 [Bipolaris maydis C5]ENH98898.1 hypothetical protein COCC4DRAFT_28839 [Bipolaris maydis ATCC 48331]